MITLCLFQLMTISIFPSCFSSDEICFDGCIILPIATVILDFPNPLQESGYSVLESSS